MKSRGMNQSQLARELFISRQQVSYLMSGQRDISLDMSIRIEALFNLKEGTLLSLQAIENVARRKSEMRSSLVNKLIKATSFWSYEGVDESTLTDDDIIENTIIHLDIEDIEQLFSLYGEKQVKSVWLERIAIQGEHLYNLNILMSMYFFGIMNPEKYLEGIERKHIKKLLAYA